MPASARGIGSIQGRERRAALEREERAELPAAEIAFDSVFCCSRSKAAHHTKLPVSLCGRSRCTSLVGGDVERSPGRSPWDVLKSSEAVSVKRLHV